jgi:hypothetical protein
MSHNESDQRLRCQGCGLTLGTKVGGLLMSRHAGRSEIVYPLVVTCPRCHVTWTNPEARISDDMGAIIKEALEKAKTTPFVPPASGSEAA